MSAGRRGRWLFPLIMLAFTALICDAAVYAFLRVFGRRHNIFLGHVAPERADIERFAARRFHPRWGWDIDPERRGALGERAGRPHEPRPRHFMKLFGDSFTYGYGVEDDQTIAHYIESETGRDCLNFAVPGYGSDQALLKYGDIAAPAEYVVLGILDENIGRCMTVWWNFYQREGFAGTKPRFMRDDGGIRLVENPSKTADDLFRLLDAAYVEALKPYDYWNGYFRRINAPARLRWPAAAVVLPHLDYFAGNAWMVAANRFRPTYEGVRRQTRVFHLYDEGSEGVAVLEHIVREFTAAARARGETPLVLLFPMRVSVDLLRDFGRKPYQPLADILDAAGAAHIDFGDVFVTEDYAAYYQAHDGHFSPEGNRRVAREILRIVDLPERLDSAG